jgi:hypothetical protein
MTTLKERIAARNKKLGDTSLVGKKVTKKKVAKKPLTAQQSETKLRKLAEDNRIRARVAKFRAADAKKKGG